MEQLVIRLPAQSNQVVHWALWDNAQQQVLASGGLPSVDTLSSLHERAGNRAVLVLVDSSAVRLTQVELPANANRKVLSSVGYMIEDDLASPVEDVFIAFASQQGAHLPLALVQHTQMQQWQDWLSDAGLVAQRIIPDILALPLPSLDDETALGATVMQLEAQTLLRDGQWTGIIGENQWIGPVINARLQQHAFIEVALLTTESSSLLDSSIMTSSPPLELPMHSLSLGANAIDFNLMQGPYAPRQAVNVNWQYWRNVAAVACVAFMLAVINKVITYQTLASQNKALQAQISQQITSDFPGLGSYRDARRAINRYVNARESAGAGTSAVNMMANLGPAFAAGNITAQTIRFDQDRNEIRMQAVASSFNDLQLFKTRATEMGFEVQEGAINNRNNLVIGSLIIRG